MQPPRKRFGAMIAIVLLHGLFFYAFAHVTTSERSVPLASLEVLLIPETEEPPPPEQALRVNLDAPTMPQIPSPEVQVAAEPPPPTAITVTTVTAPPPQPKLVGEAPKLISDPSYLRPPAPVYPRAARALRQSGLVVLRVLIDAQGRASDVKVEKSSGSVLLDDAAADAVRKAIFKPYLEDDEPRAAYALVPIEFNAARGR
jgi:protein TonB